MQGEVQGLNSSHPHEAQQSYHYTIQSLLIIKRGYFLTVVILAVLTCTVTEQLMFVLNFIDTKRNLQYSDMLCFTT